MEAPKLRCRARFAALVARALGVFMGKALVIGAGDLLAGAAFFLLRWSEPSLCVFVVACGLHFLGLVGNVTRPCLLIKEQVGIY